MIPTAPRRSSLPWVTIALLLGAGLVLLGACSGSAPSKPREFDNDLHEAVEDGSLREIRKLVELGADVNQRHSDTRETPLGLAIRLGETEAVEELLLRGANPNRRSRGSAPIHEAAARGNLEAARLLLDHGASWDVRDGDSKTPLEVAQANNQTRFYFFLEDEIRKRAKVQ